MARIAYIFTTFPKLSERFFLREVLELQKQGLEIDIYSMIGGEGKSEAGQVVEMGPKDWVCLVVELLYWLLGKPMNLFTLVSRVVFRRYGSWTNYGENLLGLAFAVRFARQFRESEYAFAHATWATAPGMAVYALRTLIGQPYTLEAHAYDVFRDGGDAFLVEKLIGAEGVRSSTDATANELRQRLGYQGAAKVICARRGLAKIPEYRSVEKMSDTLQILSVGRLIEKKGYFKQLEIYACLKARGVTFTATIVGEGPLHDPLKAAILDMELSDFVVLTGKLDYGKVEQLYLKADLFLFTGLVSTSGDRDGFPNVIGEAMSYSLPVFSTDVSGTTEGVLEGETGYLVDLSDAPEVANKLLAQVGDSEATQRVTANAHRWVMRSFSVVRNVQHLREQLWPKL